MKMLVLADLHLDEILDRAYLDHLGTAIHEAGQDADALIIAGDLAEAAAHKWPDALRWLGTLYPAAKTVIIPGNHDYYGGNLGTLDAQLDQICHAAGCAFGQGRILVFGDVRVLMTTLWTDMRLSEAERQNAVEDTLWNARQMMPDYSNGAITVDDPDRPLCPEDTIAVHESQKAWLVSELARPWSGRTVVVTHHAPSGGWQEKSRRYRHVSPRISRTRSTGIGQTFGFSDIPTSQRRCRCPAAQVCAMCRWDTKAKCL